MGQPNRQYSAGTGYRYGFNGKENDTEIKGEGNQQDYGMRIYDPRLGRFLSVDPLAKTYPELTPYQFASNSPIAGVDLDGGEFKLSILDPNITENFLQMWESGDVYSARKIIFDALHTKVSQAVIDNIYDRSTTLSDNKNFEPISKLLWVEGLTQASLQYDANIKGLQIQMNRGNGRPYNAKAQTDFTFVWGEMKELPKDKNHDSYPVDVRVINSPEFGGDFYGDNDFIGSFKMNYASLGAGAGRGTMSGHMKGYGLVSYNVDNLGLSTKGVGLEVGGLNGKFNIQDYSPSTLAGYGASFAGGGGVGVSFTKGNWYSFSNLGDMLKLNLSKSVASGTQNSMSSGIPFTRGYSLSGSVQYTFSTLKELPKPK